MRKVEQRPGYHLRDKQGTTTVWPLFISGEETNKPSISNMISEKSWNEQYFWRLIKQESSKIIFNGFCLALENQKCKLTKADKDMHSYSVCTLMLIYIYISTHSGRGNAAFIFIIQKCPYAIQFPWTFLEFSRNPLMKASNFCLAKPYYPKRHTILIKILIHRECISLRSFICPWFITLLVKRIYICRLPGVRFKPLVLVMLFFFSDKWNIPVLSSTLSS